MQIADVIEGAVQIFGRSKGKVVRKYRCTSGQRKGRIVASPTTCTAPKRVKSSIALKKAKARRGTIMKVKTKFRKRTSPTSMRITRLNKSRLKPTRRTKSRRMK